MGRTRSGWRINGFVHISPESGLSQRDVSQIVADAEGNLWLGGNHGVSHVRLEDLEAYAEGWTDELPITDFGANEGYANLEATYGLMPGGVFTRDQRVWLPKRTIAGEDRHNLDRVVKEALNKVVKHAHASEVWLRAKVTNDDLEILAGTSGPGCAFRSKTRVVFVAPPGPATLPTAPGSLEQTFNRQALETAVT